MLLPGKLRIILSASVLITVLSSCGDDDKITNHETIALYAQLNLSRMRPPGGVLILSDTISASFDSVYSPTTPRKPCRSVNMICNSYSLQWQDDIQRHIYTEESAEGFLYLGGIYIFKIDSGQAVPAFEKSIRFPTVEPSLTYPIKRSYLPGDMDSVSISSEFTITWKETSSETVELIICDETVNDYYPADTLVRIITENDGAVDVTPDDLVNLVPNNMYEIMITIRNSEAIISEGYDPRSRIIAENRTFTFFYAL